MLNDKEKALCLMELIKRKVGDHQRELIRESGNLASVKAQKVAYEKYVDSDDMGFARVDYDRSIERHQKVFNDAQAALNSWQDIQEYSYKKFINEGVGEPKIVHVSEVKKGKPTW